jgi:hypothetical protein
MCKVWHTVTLWTPTVQVSCTRVNPSPTRRHIQGRRAVSPHGECDGALILSLN